MGTLTEEIDLRIKTLVKPECLIAEPPPPPTTDLVYPSYRCAIPSSYNAPIRQGSFWLVYDVNRILHYFDNSWRLISSIQTNAPAGSVIAFAGEPEYKFIGRQHFKSAFNSDYESRYYKSKDGIHWQNTFLDRAVQGEDGNMIQLPSSKEIWNFVRPSRMRDLGKQRLYSTVSNSQLPTPIIKIMSRNTELSKLRDVYCACPILVEDGIYPKFLLFISLYRKGDLGQDVEQPPPYNPNEHVVDSYLYYYDPTNMNELRILNNGNPIIARSVSWQRYNWATLHEDTIYINTSHCVNRHTMHGTQTLNSEIFEWKLSDAKKFITQT